MRAASKLKHRIRGVMTEARRWVVASLLILLASVTPLHAQVIDIDNKQLQELLDKGVPIVDVRRLDEWQSTGIVESSELLTFFDDKGRYDAEKWFEQLSSKINTQEPIILICQVGGRTSIISKWLSKQMATVYNVNEGIVGWIEDGNTTVTPQAIADK